MKSGRELPKKVWYELEALNCPYITKAFIDFEICKSSTVSVIIDLLPILLKGFN